MRHRLGLCILLLLLAPATGALGDGQSQQPTYQRSRGVKVGGWSDHRVGSHQTHNPPKHSHHGTGFPPHGQTHHQPQVSGGYFQRPYPYHLDYYRMRWGGSYAPYFGNLYGPPNVVLGVPSFGGGYHGGYAPGPYSLPPAALPVESPVLESPPEVAP